MHHEDISLKNESESQYAAAVKNFEAAVKSLQKQNYEKAREILAKLSSAGPPDIADRARVYLRLCEHKLQRDSKGLKTGEEFYVAGVAELNARKAERAIEYLTRACKLLPGHEEVEYTLAAAYALQGSIAAALEHLKTAIDLRPQNRFQARQDEDFQSLSSDPRFLALLNVEGSLAAQSGS
ncbi:MAG: TPR end-of-group domain-containing protein [Terriglobia bacterium]